MKSVSINLIEFVKRHISHKLIHKPKINLSRESHKLLLDLFLLIKEGEKEFESAIIEEKWLEFSNSDFPKGFDFNYSPEIAKERIEKTAKFGCVFKFKINNREIQVAVIFPGDTKNNSHLCHEKLKRIFIWLYIATKHSWHKCSQKLNIYLYLIDFKKVLPHNDNTIKQEHANTGFTTTCSNSSEIHIYREEEWFKVLIHETFHNLGLDFSGMDNTKINSCIYKIFPIQTEESFFETYCEMWAEIMNILFITYFKNHKKTMKPMIKTAISMLDIEQDFSLLQANKVLKFFGISYTDLYENTEHAKNSRAHKYKEQTPIFSYFILKSMMMFFVDDFLKWCVLNNKNYIQFQQNESVLLAYCGFIREHYKNQKYLDSMRTIEEILKKGNHQSEFMNSLRMTCHEL
jgi:hypothetical protein